VSRIFAWPSVPPIVLVGPTATGKTAAALDLADRIGGEIINADSMQVYRGMDIGTAKPNAAERSRVPFHLLDVTTPDHQFTVAEWKEQAESAIVNIVARAHRPIICGGTGLYIRALLDNWQLAETPSDTHVRRELQSQAEQRGTEPLYHRLQQVDPSTAARLHPNDVVRIIRALEVFQISGIAISALQQRDRERTEPRRVHRLGLSLPRPMLYERIEQRVDAMIASGWENEIQCLLDAGYSPTLSPLKSLGYKELLQYFSGEWDRQTAIKEIKQNTRRFAKRQQTWFRADRAIAWFDVSGLNSATVAERLLTALETGEGVA